MAMLTVQQTWISPKEAAKIIGISESHARRLCRDKKLKSKLFSGVYMVDEDSAKEFAHSEQLTGRPRGS